MRKKLNYTGFLFFLLLHQSGVAQTSFSFSDYFDQFFNNYYLLNTANSDSSYKTAVNISNKTQTGLFKGVNKLYMDVDMRISSRKGVYHFIGIQAINNKEGEFISKNRLTGRYSWHGKISGRASVSAGISLGFVNYSFNTSQSGTGGSDWVPDGNAGIWYLRKKISLGVSTQQIFNQKIRPANQTFLLSNYYNFTARYLIDINHFLNLHTHLYTRHQNDQPMYFAIASLLETKGKLESGIGIGYNYRRGLNSVVGLKRIRIGSSHFGFYFSYFVGTSRINNVSDTAFELLVKYQR